MRVSFAIIAFTRMVSSAYGSHRNPVFRRTLAQIAGSLWDILPRSPQISLVVIPGRRIFAGGCHLFHASGVLPPAGRTFSISTL